MQQQTAAILRFPKREKAAPQGSIVPAYRIAETNRCPGCRASNWIVRTMTAECGRCGYALVIGETA